MSINLHEDINFVYGKLPCNPKITVVFDKLVIEFLNSLSIVVAKDNSINKYEDLKTFGFWCRKKNILKLAEEYKLNKTFIGRGIVFHVTPSNVALNFAYSLAFGLLSGNSNIVRLPSKKFNQVILLCNIIKQLLKKSIFNDLSKLICLIQYERNDKISAFLSNIANARVIWGGNETIRQFKSFPTMPRCVDIMFPDRYSISIIDISALNGIKEDKMSRLVEHFFNDTYLMDQQGCSSPHLVVWVGKENEEYKEKFWTMLNAYVDKNYESELPVTNEKIIDMALNAVNTEMKYNVFFKNFKLVRNIIKDDCNKIELMKGKFGAFSEISVNRISEISSIITNNIQTITYFGLNKDDIRQMVVDNGLLGVDRIVPVGRAFDMGLFWDGFDIIRSLSRSLEY